MSGRVEVQPIIAALAVGAGLACAAGLFCGLSVLARPAGFSTRLAALQDEYEDTLTDLRLADPARAYPEGAVCPLSAPQAKSAIDLAVKNALARERIAGGAFVTKLQPRDGRLTSVNLSIRAEARTDQLMALLRDLASVRPVIFADTVDLTPQPASTRFDLEGRVLCSA